MDNLQKRPDAQTVRALRGFRGLCVSFSSCVDTLYTFWDNITHSKTKSVHFWGLMNSATKKWVCA